MKSLHKSTLFSLMLLAFFVLLITKPVLATEKLPLPKESNITYATVNSGDTLEAKDFIPGIKELNDLTVKDIKFLSNHRANTSSQGLSKTEVTFTTNDGKTFTAKLPYLVENSSDTISLDNIHYNKKSKLISFKTSDSQSPVYMVTEDTIYSCLPDANGLFKGVYNPNKLPETLQFVTFDKDGNYSPSYTYQMANGKTTTKDQTLLLDNSLRNKLLTENKILKPVGATRTRSTVTILIVVAVIAILFLFIRFFFKHQHQN